MTDDRPLRADVFRVCVALSGDADVAERALCEVVERSRDLAGVGESRLVRHAVSACRRLGGEGVGGWAPGDGPARAAWDAAGRLERLEREAWILREVRGLGPGEMAQAFGDRADDAASAFERATASVRGALGDGHDGAVAALRDAVGGVGADAALASAEAAWARGRRRRRIVAGVELVALVVCMGLMIYVLVDLLGWDEEQAAREAEQMRYSNPVPRVDER